MMEIKFDDGYNWLHDIAADKWFCRYVLPEIEKAVYKMEYDNAMVAGSADVAPFSGEGRTVRETR